MSDMGIGDMNWVQDYVGLPYEMCGRSFEGVDCWGLVVMVYRNELGIVLPDWVTDEEIDWESERGAFINLDTPTDYCLVRTPRSGRLPDHWGLFIAGGVLSADKSGSSFTAISHYIRHNPDATFGAFKVREDLQQ